MENVSVLVAIGVDETGYRKILGVSEGAKEDRESWLNFLRHLKERGLKGVRLFISDKCLGLVEALGEVYPESKWQRCVVHFYRNVCPAPDLMDSIKRRYTGDQRGAAEDGQILHAGFQA